LGNGRLSFLGWYSYFSLKRKVSKETFRACLINGGMTSSERFFHQTRQKIAGILCVFQDFLTQSGGKRSAVWAF
jgi:hypothetical protein